MRDAESLGREKLQRILLISRRDFGQEIKFARRFFGACAMSTYNSRLPLCARGHEAGFFNLSLLRTKNLEVSSSAISIETLEILRGE